MGASRGQGLAVRCQGLVKRYRDVTAVAGLDLEVETGECVGLLGPNGAGKTTTVEMIEGLTLADEGSVEVFGARWGGAGDRALRARLGVQLQQVDFDERLTLIETVRLFRSFFEGGRSPDEVIQLLGLVDKRGARVGKLSGGQQQRLALACALVGTPDLLCLDEPTTGLDPQARRLIWEVVERFRAGGGTVLLTTHYMEEATRLCDRVAFVDRGRIVACDSPAGLIAALGGSQIVEFDGVTADVEDVFDGAAGVTGARREPAAGRGSDRGDTWVLTVDDAAGRMPGLLSRLAARGAAPTGIRTHAATLEDVFIALTGRGLADDSAGVTHAS